MDKISPREENVDLILEDFCTMKVLFLALFCIYMVHAQVDVSGGSAGATSETRAAAERRKQAREELGLDVENAVRVDEDAIDDAANALKRAEEARLNREQEDARKAAALAEGQKLREEAKKRAQERVKRMQDGKPAEDDKKKQSRKGLTKQQIRELEKQERKLERLKVLREKEAEIRKHEQTEGIDRRRLEEAAGKPACDDGAKNGLETDVDCGGEVCRDETFNFNGVEIPRKCSYAQKCEINYDCISGKCTNKVCQPRVPFQPLDEDSLLQNMHKAFFQIAEEKGAETLSPSDVERFMLLTVNPDGQDLEPTHETFFAKEVTRFRTEQGLMGPDSAGPNLLYGFLTRGHCFNFAKRLLEKAQSLSVRYEL